MLGNRKKRVVMIISFIVSVNLIIHLKGFSSLMRYSHRFNHRPFQVKYTKDVNDTGGNNTNPADRFPPISLVIKPNCLQRKSGKLTLSDHDHPRTELASPWRSGNTWVRHLLQMATGIGPSALYCDFELRIKGFPFECSHGQFNRTLVVKSHEPTYKKRKISQPFERVVLIIREPYNFIVGNTHLSHLDTTTEDAVATDRHSQQPHLLNRWNVFNNYYLREIKGPVYPLLYLKLLLDTETELKKVLEFLRVEYTEPDVKFAIENKEGYFHRKSMNWSKIRDVTELFNNTMRSEIDHKGHF